VGKSVYTLHTSVSKSWEKAKEFCAEQKGRQLAIIPTSREENQEFFNKLEALSGEYNMCSVIFLHLHIYTCIPTPVFLHLYIYTCIPPPVSLHLYLYTCILTPVSLHLYLYTCIPTPVSLHL